MQKLSALRMTAKLPDPFMGKNATSGGSRETEEKVPTTMPAGAPSTIAVTTATPVG